jgi:hypothetical protein
MEEEPDQYQKLDPEEVARIPGALTLGQLDRTTPSSAAGAARLSQLTFGRKHAARSAEPNWSDPRRAQARHFFYNTITPS